MYMKCACNSNGFYYLIFLNFFIEYLMLTCFNVNAEQAFFEFPVNHFKFNTNTDSLKVQMKVRVPIPDFQQPTLTGDI